ncbi:MAG: hypothetical protein EXS02_13510 [Planctomycetes bacterium]|nr:hypothetical protein [Planctomycetota bacterium]
MRALLLSSLSLLSGVPCLSAQKMPAAGDPDRVVAVYPLAEAVDRAMEHAGRSLRGDDVPPQTMRDECHKRLRNAICRFVQPPLGDGEHVVDLGSERLVALVRPTQAAWIDDFFRRLAAADHAARLDATFERVTIPAARLAEILGRQDLPDHVEVLLDAEQLKALHTGTRERDGPLSWRFPHATWMIFGGGMSFVTDWKTVPLRGQDERLVAPVLGTVHDGVEFEVQYVPLPADRIGFSITGEWNIVDWKTPPRSKHIGDRDYVIDEPDSLATKFDATLTMDKPVPFAFGRRIGDDVMLMVFVPKSR